MAPASMTEAAAAATATAGATDSRSSRQWKQKITPKTLTSPHLYPVPFHLHPPLLFPSLSTFYFQTHFNYFILFLLYLLYINIYFKLLYIVANPWVTHHGCEYGYTHGYNELTRSENPYPPSGYG